MSVVLDYWNRRWQSVAFNCMLGRGRVRWLARRRSRCAGWAFLGDRRWYAVRLERNELVFQAGPHIWPMNGEFRCENVRRDKSRLFTIYHGEHIVLQVKYDVLPALDEPITDRLDLETTDFFYWATLVWNDPGLKASLRAAWRETESAA